MIVEHLRPQPIKSGRHRQGALVVMASYLAANHWGARDHRDEHPCDAHVGAEHRAAHHDGGAVEQGQIFAEMGEFGARS